MGIFVRKILIVSAILLCGAVSGFAAAPAWESVRGERAQTGRVVAHNQDVEVRTYSGTIIIATQKPVQVKVFSILGQLVSQENLPAGVSQLELGVHGVYIVKIGSTTIKVAL